MTLDDEAAVDHGTRARVSREILQHGPVSARELGANLGLTPAAVRRHLDGLTAQGLVEVWSPAEGGPRGRGRPARRFVLTDAGHAAMSTAYDDLAAQLLEFLAATAGPEAVLEFAAVRADRLAERYRSAVEAAGIDPHRRAGALAQALSVDGYAASVRSVDDGQPPVLATVAPAPGSVRARAPAVAAAGKQLCQGHCPVQQVASLFPQLCEAETRAFSDLLGVHVQRLATLAHGEHACTTHIPLTAVRTTGASTTAPTSTAPTSTTISSTAGSHHVTRGEFSR